MCRKRVFKDDIVIALHLKKTPIHEIVVLTGLSRTEINIIINNYQHERSKLLRGKESLFPCFR